MIQRIPMLTPGTSCGGGIGVADSENRLKEDPVRSNEMREYLEIGHRARAQGTGHGAEHADPDGTATSTGTSLRTALHLVAMFLFPPCSHVLTICFISTGFI